MLSLFSTSPRLNDELIRGNSEQQVDAEDEVVRMSPTSICIIISEMPSTTSVLTLNHHALALFQSLVNKVLRAPDSAE
jgi:hypothetical protein